MCMRYPHYQKEIKYSKMIKKLLQIKVKRKKLKISALYRHKKPVKNFVYSLPESEEMIIEE
jgi:hypothetical protein